MSDVTTAIWDKYQKGVEHHRIVNMYSEANKEHRFYAGDQWHGIDSGGEDFPIFNFIKPVVKYKVSMIAQNLMRVVYLSMSNDETVQRVCEQLTKFAGAQWEKLKMDSVAWSILKNAAIVGDHYVYCFDERNPSESVVTDLKPQLKMRLVDKTNVYLSDEQNPTLSEQEYIIISERVPVAKLKRIAKDNGVEQSAIDLITSDEETEDDIGQKKDREVKTDEGKCTSLLYMELTPEGLKFCRSTQGCIYQPEKTVDDLDVYPLVSLRWEEVKGDARGASAVKQMIPNQLEVNKTAARRAVACKRYSFPTTVVDKSRVQNPENLDNVGATIYVDGLAQNPINQFVDYLKPVPMSADAANFQNELIDRTQTLEGAGDAALGNVDPTKASGEAIKAARDQAAVPLNEQISSYKQFVEDIAMLWYKLWVVYSLEGMQIGYMDANEAVTEVIPKELLDELDVDIKIEVSPVDPYSQLSQEIALERLLSAQMISFEEYVEALSDDSSVPKAKLTAMLDKRAAEAQQQALIDEQNAAAASSAAISEQETALVQEAEDNGIPPEMLEQVMQQAGVSV